MLDHLQLDWDVDHLAREWPVCLDSRFLLQRLDELTAATTLAGGATRVLDVAAAGAEHTCEMSRRGASPVALDPSATMLEAARRRIVERRANVLLVRGIAETLPFRTAAFDRVLCHSAIDHVAAPDAAVREMARVLAPDGRLVISAVNYGSASARSSRLLYAAARRLRMFRPDTHWFWDSPVPVDHTFECTHGRLRRLCSPYFDLDHSLGVSIGWNVPAWGMLLDRLPRPVALAILHGLDRCAARIPGVADFIYTVWRPRPVREWRLPLPAREGGFVIQPDDVTYPHRARTEARFWGMADFKGTLIRPQPTGVRLSNQAYTGDPGRSWMDDLIARGPYRRVAVLGCDEERYDARWLRLGGSQWLDIYELSPSVIRKVRAALAPWQRRVRFIRADLNFAPLPARRYDLIWSSGCLHHIVNLEHLFRQVARALRPGGLFALHDYVGDRRRQYHPERLVRANAVLRAVPQRFRFGGTADIATPDPATLSPFCAARSDDILALAEASFDPVHIAAIGALFPLPFYLDLDAIAREEPQLIDELEAAEATAMRGATLGPCSAYAVYRKR